MGTIRMHQGSTYARACLAFVFISFNGSLLVASSTVRRLDAMEAKIDGDYGVMPAQASDDLSLTQPLGSLLIDPAKIRAIDGTKIHGKLEFIRLLGGKKDVQVTMVDTSGNAFFSEVVKAELVKIDDRTGYVIEHNWAFGSEWGSSRGATKVTLSKSKQGYLVVSLDMRGQGRTFILPRGPRTAQAWLKYPSVSLPEPATLAPTDPKIKEGRANGLFGRDR